MDAIKHLIKSIKESSASSACLFKTCLSKSILLSAILLLSGCNSDGSSHKESEHVASQLSRSIIEQTNKIGELIPSSEEVEKTSSEQIEKTFMIEYRTVTLKHNASSEEIQSLLSQLGKERWDCFSLTHSTDGQSVLLCKRRPLSALRALLGVGGLMMW